MPNWSYNTLTADGSNEDIAAMLAFVKGEDRDLDFNKIIPIPQALFDTVAGFGGTEEQQAKRAAQYADNKAKYGYENWYDACVELWDTKWNARDVQLDTSDGWAQFDFATAWSPPTKVLIALSKKFPNIKFEFEAHEESGEFHYRVDIIGGNYGAEVEVPWTFADDGEEEKKD